MTEPIFKYLALLFDSIHFPVEVINEEGKIVYVNHAFTFQWGYNVNELKEYSIYNDAEIKNKQNIFKNYQSFAFYFFLIIRCVFHLSQ